MWSLSYRGLQFNRGERTYTQKRTDIKIHKQGRENISNNKKGHIQKHGTSERQRVGKL